MLDIVGKRKLWYLISLVAIVPGLISLLVYDLNLGIDFTGGTVWEFDAARPVQPSEIRRVLADNGFPEAVVQIAGEKTVVIRMKELQEGSPVKAAIIEDFTALLGSYDANTEQFAAIGPSVGTAIRNRAVIAIGLAAIGVLLYIAFAFRNTEKPLHYGVCAIIAMVHDIVFVLGVFSILGWVADVQIDALFVTAILTVMGFSVHDTIVVFDRIRENLARKVAPTFEETVNYSIVQTIVRSLNTSITVVLTLAALFLFGGESTRYFVLALLIGVIAGTYSSIFNASQVLVSWEQGEIQRLFKWRPWARQRATAA
ncbi:MAG: protein translocase subunit SecF [Chloroflexi bacterium]|nr:MAG: protein translocase subunit SecF [Chloroflexota bacterium]